VVNARETNDPQQWGLAKKAKKNNLSDNDNILAFEYDKQ